MIFFRQNTLFVNFHIYQRYNNYMNKLDYNINNENDYYREEKYRKDMSANTSNDDYRRRNENNYKIEKEKTTALEVFDSLQENIKKEKEGQINNFNNNQNSIYHRSGNSSGRVLYKYPYINYMDKISQTI